MVASSVSSASSSKSGFRIMAFTRQEACAARWWTKQTPAGIRSFWKGADTNTRFQMGTWTGAFARLAVVASALL